MLNEAILVGTPFLLVSTLTVTFEFASLRPNLPVSVLVAPIAAALVASSAQTVAPEPRARGEPGVACLRRGGCSCDSLRHA